MFEGRPVRRYGIARLKPLRRLLQRGFPPGADRGDTLCTGEPRLLEVVRPEAADRVDGQARSARERGESSPAERLRVRVRGRCTDGSEHAEVRAREARRA